MANSVSGSAERGPSTTSVEKSRLIVTQPAKVTELIADLETFEKLSMRVSETTGEDRSGDLGSAGAGSGGQQGTQGTSARDQAIANLPSAAAMQKKLTEHARQEAKKLERLARRLAHSSAPGSAHKLNELYANIRRLHSLAYEILEASLDVLKRLFIRVFVDQQPIL